MENQTLRAVVHGVVQGVCFRYYTQKTAVSLGLNGWVKNLPNGTVALEAIGAPDALEELAAWLKTGPAHARVTRVDETWGETTGAYASFDIVQ